MVPVMLGQWLGRSGLVTKHWRFNPATQATFQAQAALGFYDTWVARSRPRLSASVHLHLAIKAVPRLSLTGCH